tara:strand:+ start:1716 stop:1979 length:264 start_codon:yes stop_codon:yes gene_type:complete
MLTYEDCLDVSGLSQDEVDAVAEYEHAERLPALAECDFLLHSDGGVKRIRYMIVDDIREAQRSGHQQHARELRRVLTRFNKHHAFGA